MESFNLGLLLLRVAVGVTVALHGYGKVFLGGRLEGTARWFASMGLRPGWLHARLAAYTEIAAGLALAAGFFTPFAAMAIVGLMAVAAWVSHRKNGFFIFRPGEGWEYVMILGVAATSLGAMGPGEWSVDDALDLSIDGWGGVALVAGGGIGGALLLLLTMYRPGRTTS